MPWTRRSFRGEVELDEGYFGGRGKGTKGRWAAGKVPVFLILERDGQVRAEDVPNLKVQTVPGLTVAKIRRGGIVNTDKYQIYDAQMFCGYRELRVDHEKRVTRGRVYIKGLESFWSRASWRIRKFHGVNSPSAIKEMEFRYNHRQDDIFPIVENSPAICCRTSNNYQIQHRERCSARPKPFNTFSRRARGAFRRSCF